MKFDKREANVLAEACFSRHNIGHGNKRGAEEHVAKLLNDGTFSLGDLAEIFITVYRNFHPKLRILNLDNGA